MSNRRFVTLLALLLWVSPPAFAQSPTGSIEGVVVDSTGAVLPGVSVTLTHQSTGASRETATDAEGVFRAPVLPVGPYTVRAQLSGFQTVERRDVTLTVGQTLSLHLAMPVSTMSETVDVSGAVPIVETTRSQVSSTVNAVSVENLPVNGRNFIDFALLTPGVTRDVRTGDISFAGQRGTLNSLVVDGADNNNTFFGQTLGRTGSGRAPYQFSQDAVQEFQVNSNAYSAEYGRAGGAVINVVTKSGTNTPHGSVFEFYRDKKLNANDAINVLNNRPKSPVRRELWRSAAERPAFRVRQLRRPAEYAAKRRVPQSAGGHGPRRRRSVGALGADAARHQLDTHAEPERVSGENGLGAVAIAAPDAPL
jgi:hypothetical protein